LLVLSCWCCSAGLKVAQRGEMGRISELGIWL
jgi:hypothetical protein